MTLSRVILPVKSLCGPREVPSYIVRKAFTHIFSFINVQLFNSLLLRRECCSFSNGEYVRSGLAELERWCYNATDEYAGSAWDELKHIRQAIGFLVIHQKPQKTLDEISSELCPVLSMQQLYRISTMYWDDKYSTQSLSPDAYVCHAYQLLKRGGLHDDNIIVFMYDDIAYNPSNPRPGSIINHPRGADVYKDTPKDYTGVHVTTQNVIAAVLGNKSAITGGSRKVVNSGPNDYIFIYYSDHGDRRFLSMPVGPPLYHGDLIDLLKRKHASAGYKSLIALFVTMVEF